MDLNARTDPALALRRLYLLAAAAIWLAARPDCAWTPAVAAGHLALALIPAGGSRAARRLAGLAPALVWIAGWTAVGRFHELGALRAHDDLIRALDARLFGLEWPGGWTAAPGWLDAPAHAVYLSYYLLVLGPSIVLMATGRAAAGRRMAGDLLGAYLLCFLVYHLFPVVGPRDAALAGREAGGLVCGWVEGLRALGDSPGTAFPSSHCAGSLMSALLARTAFGRRTGRLLVAWALLVGLSTVITRNHYVCDMVAGLALAAALHATLAGLRARPPRFAPPRLPRPPRSVRPAAFEGRT